MDNEPREEGSSSSDSRGRPPGGGRNLWLLVILLATFGAVLWMYQGPKRSEINETFFKDQIAQGNVEKIKIGAERAEGNFREAPPAPKEPDKEGNLVQKKDKEGNPLKLHEHFKVNLPPAESSARDRIDELLEEHGVQKEYAESSENTWRLIVLAMFVLPIIILVFFFVSFRRSRDQMLGGGFLSGFSRSPAKRYEAQRHPITFDDVAGLEGVKADLMEIVDYLKHPDKFQRLGGRVPKGVLLNGPPGTGKTLLARAVAGEAGAPFYSVTGSEFIQMFVGVGASRVRDLFKTAKENAPAIIFIDEIDAVGRQRGAGLGGGHDEREQTLNQILSEMDGFTQHDSVIVVAATNRPDVLDPALLRPGRFDRHVTVDRPTHKGRVEIFKVHVRDVPLSEDVDLNLMASSTVGLTGADIRNIVNEAALWAARQDKNKVEMSDFHYASDKVLMGAKREEVLQDDEKEKTAYHESGHALLGWISPGAHRVHKVTIIPRGRFLGATQTFPSEDRLSMSEHELRDHLVVLLGGRSAEKLIYDETTIGAENDLERATSMARRMVTHWGMSERLGPVSYKMSDADPFLGREIHQQRQFSEHTMELIDEEVARILHDSSERASDLLIQNRDKLETLTKALLEAEELNDKEITSLIGPSVQAAESNGRYAAPEAAEGPAAKKKADV